MTGELPDMQPDKIPITSLDRVLNEWVETQGLWHDVSDDDVAVLRSRLIAREENIKTILAVAGRQFALPSEVVAEVLAQVGLGEPLDQATRNLIHDRYQDAVNKIVSDNEASRHRRDQA